jgi:hypothetical protein
MRPLPMLLITLGALSATAAQPARAVLPCSEPVMVAAVTVGNEPRVEGSGRIVEEPRALSGFVAVHAKGPINVELRAADRESVTVKGDDNVLPLIETRIAGGERPALEIAVRPGASFRTRRSPLVIVEFRSLSELVLQGSGDVHADRIHGNDFALSMSGSGDVRIDQMEVQVLGAVLAGSGDLRVSGHAAQQAFRLAGSGDAFADGLQGRHIKAALAGSGDARVHALESLDVTIAGSGDVTYRGSPTVTQRVAGSGSVRARR